MEVVGDHVGGVAQEGFQCLTVEPLRTIYNVFDVFVSDFIGDVASLALNIERLLRTTEDMKCSLPHCRTCGFEAGCLELLRQSLFQK